MSCVISGASFSNRRCFLNFPKCSSLTFGDGNVKFKRRSYALHLSTSNKCFSSDSDRLNLHSLAKSVSSNFYSPVYSRAVAFEAPSETSELVFDRFQRLVYEFRSLSQPIDRVKRLLHYATILAPLDESARVSENRVTGCTTQVWLEATMDESGRMRFRADSDSEITKGFCSCLIWVLDGADPEVVLKIRAEDLEAINVGLYGKAQSRVNTWHNVLISMQKRTEALCAEREH